jgi:hypothetical protein
MADKSAPLILEALGRAVADPAGLALHGNKNLPGLFPATAAARQAAQRCKDEGYLRVLRTETRGKTACEVCAITEKGLAFLLSQVSPRQVLEDFVRSLEDRRSQVGELVAAARQTQATFDGLRETVEKVLQQLGKPQQAVGESVGLNGADAWKGTVLSYLSQWQTARPSEDCPLPELYRQARQLAPTLTIGHFHDGLRRLHDQEQIYLHPWTGPLYDLPEPPYALLIGHEIAYYASLRQ